MSLRPSLTPVAMKIRVTRLKGGQSKTVCESASTSFSFGTAAECDVRLDAVWDRGVAAHHARVSLVDSGFEIKDTGSKSGTFLNGKRLGGEAVFGEDVEIQLGLGGPRFRLQPLHEHEARLEDNRLQSVSQAKKPVSVEQGRIKRSRVVFVGAALLGLAAVAVAVLGIPRDGGRAALGKSLQPTAPTTEPELASDIPRASEKDWRKDPILTAFHKFWELHPPKSPYVRSYLENEGHWFELRSRYQRLNERSPIPGIFVGEYYDVSLAIPPVPEVNPDLSLLLRPALLGDSSSSVARPQIPPVASDGSPWRIAEAARQHFESRILGTQKAGGRVPKAWAVLVGVNKFETISPLFSSRNDVAALAKVLTSHGIVETERMCLMTDARARESSDYPNKKNVIHTLKRVLSQAAADDVVFVVFSSHGGYDEESRDAFFCTTDTSQEVPGIYGRELQSLMESSQARNILIMLDTCHSGGTGALGNPKRALSFAENSPLKGPRSIPESFYDELAKARGSIVIRACRADQTTLDLKLLGQGFLTMVAVCGLTGDADANNDGIVTLSELRVYVTKTIPAVCQLATKAGYVEPSWPLQPTFTSGGAGEAGDLPLTVVNRR